MRKSNQLTALRIAKLKKPGRYGDGLGLWLQVAPGGSRSWLFRFQRDGHARQMGLGPLHTVTLAEAREKAREARQALLAGLDPIEARAAQRAKVSTEAARGVTFQQAAEGYIAAHASSWKNKAHAAQWPSSMSAYAYPILGGLSVASIDTALVLKALEPIWHEKPETASRVRGRIELVLDWAAARGHRSDVNPAR